MALSPESPLGTGSSRDFQGLLDKDSVKLYYNQAGGATSSDRGSRQFDMDAGSSNPWGAPSDLWDHDDTLMESQEQMQLSFLDQPKGMGSLPGQSPFEGSGDSVRLEGMSSANHTLHDLILPAAPSHSIHSTVLAESPMGSTPSDKDAKQNSDRDVKQEMRVDSSDGSDPLDDDDDKGGGRSGRRHLSKNLVAERKRRKKLNERLYSLRALVPKITKMDRASILGDAIEYVKELQQRVKDLQVELFEPTDDEPEHHQDEITNGQQQFLQDGQGGSLVEEERAVAKVDQPNLPTETMEPHSDDILPPMQVEVTKIDNQLFNLRIFCEKRPGLLVELMEKIEALGLDIVHTNITTFRGSILNIFNAKSKDGLQAERIRETLLELSHAGGGLRQGCPSGDTQIVETKDKAIQH